MKRILTLAVIGLFLICMPAFAAPTLDLTSVGSSGYIGPAYFEQYSPQPTGTGYIDSFVRISAANQDIVQGYNTGARPLEYDENSSPNYTRALPLSSVPTVNGYRVFLLDINQTMVNSDLSLDALQVYMSTTGSPTGYAADPANLGTLIYDLDAGGDNWIHLDYALNHGSGSGDMLFYLPDSLFVGGDFITLYSRFGENYSNNDGYEEWAAVIPTPGALILGSIGVCVTSFLRRRRTL